MDEIRLIRNSDRDELRSLWSLRFSDSPGFTDWYFQNRYCTAHSMCMFANGRIVSAIHCWPMRVRVRETVLSALMLSGVATLPGYEKQGRMHKVMEAVLRHARQEGFPLVFHKPVDVGVYASLGHLPCTDTLMYRAMEGTCTPAFSGDWNCAELLRRYRLATNRYSGVVVRDETDMRLKLDDYRSDGAFLLCPKALEAYAVLFSQDGGWYAEEALAADPESYRTLMRLLPSGATVKLPPDCGLRGEIAPQNVMGAVNVPALLSALCKNPALVFEVQDPVLPENCGRFDGLGQPSTDEPIFTGSVGELLQILSGYRAFEPYFPALPCYCVDEY